MSAFKKHRGVSGKKSSAATGRGRSAKNIAITTTISEKKGGTPKGAIFKVKRHTAAAAPTMGLHYKSPVEKIPSKVAIRLITRRRKAYSEADEQMIVRLAKAAEQARVDPGEDLSGLSREDFLARLLG